MNFDLDYFKLNNDISTKRVLKLNDVKNKIEKVAFDLVRFVDDNTFDHLWRIEQRDGNEVIVALYEDGGMEVLASKETDWSVALDKKATCLNIFYKGEPIKKISVASLDIPSEEAKILAKSLPKSLASDKILAKTMLNEFSASEKASIYSKFPELK